MEIEEDKLARIRRLLDMADECFGAHGDCIDTGLYPEFTEGLGYFYLVSEMLE
jgi:hypothetical protein